MSKFLYIDIYNVFLRSRFLLDALLLRSLRDKTAIFITLRTHIARSMIFVVYCRIADAVFTLFNVTYSFPIGESIDLLVVVDAGASKKVLISLRCPLECVSSKQRVILLPLLTLNL